MTTLVRRFRFRIIFIPTVLFSIVALYYIFKNHYQIKNTLSYATRPLWDAADGPKEVIPHYYAEGMKMDSHACQLHGWQANEDQESINVMDAVLMSSELDLLEIRMNELDSVVDNFFIIESNATFTGLPKETYFAQNRERFSRFEKKIVYRLYVATSIGTLVGSNALVSLPGFPLKAGQSAWDVEAATRDSMTTLLRSHFRDLPQTKILVLMSDIDEIPSSHTMALLKACDFGQSIHLQLRNFLYRYVFCQ
jgi:beta-1,4-mannosyl-glycoprotein beta-1,4-N-acetylglucosaminyltransferase